MNNKTNIITLAKLFLPFQEMNLCSGIQIQVYCLQVEVVQVQVQVQVQV